MDGTQTILVIDDEENIRELVRAILENAGYTVLEAADGSIGIEVFRANQVDLIITDLIMPGKEGIETISELKKEQPDVKVIAMSGAVNSSTYLHMAGSLGADETISKPFHMHELLETVERLLNQ
ncbi:response regulator [Gemmatimonadota bacterium]